MNDQYFKEVMSLEHAAMALRSIRKPEDFWYMYNNTCPKYTIYNEESFMKYFINFDISFYKKTYLEDDQTMSDWDVMLHYKNIGILNKYKINKKRRILFVVSSFDRLGGGIMAIFNIAKIINEMSDLFYTEILPVTNNRIQNNIYNNYANTLDDEDTIVVYPCVMHGNPLGLKCVVRWILLDLGIEMPYNHHETFGKDDLVYEWNENCRFGKVLRLAYIDKVYKYINSDGGRYYTCYIIKKGGVFHEQLNYIHPDDSVLISDQTNDVKSLIFNSCRYFYCYDPYTMYNFYSMVCGCLPVIYPMKGLSKSEFAKKYFFGIKTGFMYGLDDDEDEARATLEDTKNKFIQLFNKDIILKEV